MENIKINLKYLFILATSIVLAEPMVLSLNDAMEQYKCHNTEVKHLEEQILLIEKKSTLHSHQYRPGLSTIKASYDPLENIGKVQSGVYWNLPTGGNVHLDISKKDRDDPKYTLRFDQPIPQGKPTQDAQKTISIEIETLQKHDQLEGKFLAFRQYYRQCVQEHLQLKQQEQSLSVLHINTKKQKLLYEYGEISKLALEKAIAALERKGIDILKLERQYELNMIKLKQQLGLDMQQQIILDETIAFQETPLIPSHAITAAFQHNRPYQISLLNKQLGKLQYHAAKVEQHPKIKVFGSVDQDSETKLGISLSLTPPSEETQYTHAKNTLDYLQSQQTATNAEMDLKTKIHSDLINLTHQKSLITLGAKRLKQQQVIYQAETLKLQHQEISTETFEEASDQLESAYLESLSAQTQYANDHEAFMQSTGQFHTLTIRVPSDE